METDTLLLSSQQEIWSVQFQPFTTGIIVSFCAFVILIMFSALLSGAEVAFFMLSTDNKLNFRKTNKNNTRILNILDNHEKMLSAILVANSFFKIVIIVLFVFIFNHLVHLQDKPITGFFLQIALITFIFLLFTEILPRFYAARNSLQLMKLMALPLIAVEKMFRPVSRLYIALTLFVNRQLQKHTNNISIDDFSHVFKLTSEQELSEEKEILQGIVKFGNKNVAEIMKSRVDVVSIDIKNNFHNVLETVVQSGFSRIPVYTDSFDNIKGILYIKDILPHSHKGASFKWQTLIRPPFYVPETKKINSLLKEFQKNKVHLAVVIDEYGGTSGIVTLEDVLEEIVGDIVDEFDEEEHFFSVISENIFLFDGKTLLGDFYKISKCDDSIFSQVKGDAETLAGLILELKGEIPELHEKIEYRQFVFTIEEVDDRRIKQIKVEIDRNYEQK